MSREIGGWGWRRKRRREDRDEGEGRIGDGCRLQVPG